MNDKSWFELIKQWRETGRGVYGLTFPFLIGALSKLTNRKADLTFVSEVFSMIIEQPVPGYYSEVRWCGNIDEPVISVNPISNLGRISNAANFKANDSVSLVFTSDLMNMFHLNCKTSEECLSKLIEMTYNITKDNCFSKNNGVFADFSDDDLVFISLVLDENYT